MLSDYLNSKPPKYKVGDLYYGEKKMIGVVFYWCYTFVQDNEKV